MTTHRYDVSGLDDQGNRFVSECYDDDIIKAINQYRNIHYSVHSITRQEQVKRNTEKKIIFMQMI